MKKLLLSSFFLGIISLVIVFFQISSCQKTNVETPTPVCDVTGKYTGTSIDNGKPSPMTYDLRTNDFAVGSAAPTDPAVSFGSYTNTCDSVIMTVYYTLNSDYYLLRGKLLNNKTTISGTFYNLTLLSDSGTFTISR
jgi:hypothetical protein